MYCLAVEHGKPFRAVFADTGHESSKTLEYVASLPERAGGPPIATVKADYSAKLAERRRKLPGDWRSRGISETRIETALALLQPTGIPFLDAVMYEGLFPNGRQRYCTHFLKVQPITAFMRPLLESGRHCVSWQGMRADESVVRSAMQPRQRISGQYGTYHVLRPLLAWTVDDVLAMHKRHNLKANPLYGEGFSRVGCFPCIYASKGEIALLADRYPEAVDKLESWERLLSDVSRKDGPRSFFNAVRDPTWEKGQPTGIRRIVSWARTAHGGRQFALLPKVSRAQQMLSESCAEHGVCRVSGLASRLARLASARSGPLPEVRNRGAGFGESGKDLRSVGAHDSTSYEWPCP